MKMSWSAVKTGGIGVVALTLSLVSQQIAGAQSRPVIRPVSTQLTPTNRTLSNYYAFQAAPGNPLSPNNQLNNQIYNYYQGQSNQQLNTVTGIIGNNLSPLVPQ